LIGRRGVVALLVLALGSVPTQGRAGAGIATPYPFSRDHQPGDTYMGVRLLGVLKLASVRVDGHLLTGLSALAWDDDEEILYALSDRGVLFHLWLRFDEQGLLADARALRAFALRDVRGKPLAGRRADSEGLVARNADNGVRGDSELLVSFERMPRVLRFTPAGEPVGALALPGPLRERANYRSANRMLESLAWHPRHGALSAPEQPFHDAADGQVPLHALGSRRHWRYPLAPEPNAGLTALEVLADGSLLTLERGYGVFFVPVITTLRRIRVLPARDGAVLDAETVARFSTGQGWALDNFEGLTRQIGSRILLVSDDNARAFQSTLLAAFELLDTDSSAPAAADRE
jgi:hypothetical protein